MSFTLSVSLSYEESAVFWYKESQKVNSPPSSLWWAIMCHLSDPPWTGLKVAYSRSHSATLLRFIAPIDWTSHVSCHSPKRCVTPKQTVYAFPPLTLLHCTQVQNEMQTSKSACQYWHPVWTEMSMFILWAEFISWVCYTQFRCASFPSEWQMRRKILTSKTRSLKALTPLSSMCQNWTEQREETLYQKAGGLGCQRMVTFCVERHYDNEHSFSITSTSWAPFPLMYFSEGNGLWQSYLLHCIAGLFLEVTFKKSARENICENLYQSSFLQCIIGCYGK